MINRKFWVLLGIALLITGLFSFWPPKAVNSVNSLANTTVLTRGVNLAHWFSHFPEEVSDKHLQTWITEADFKNIADAGMNHVRILVAADKLSKPQYSYLDQALKWGNKYNLATIVDIHPTSRLYVNRKINVKAVEELKQFWVEFARRYQNQPQKVFYEILSESEIDDTSLWHELAESLVKVIRQIDQRHTLIIGAPEWSTPERFYDLIPVQDKNAIYAFHFYKPMAFTHQGASWVGGLGNLQNIPYPYDKQRFEQATRGITDPESLSWLSEYGKYNKEKLEQDLRPVIDFRARYQLPVYCGELGVYKWGAPERDRLLWHQDLTQLLRQNDIGYGFWEYRSGFGIFDKQKNEFDWPLLTASGL